jgi:transposase-like protein
MDEPPVFPEIDPSAHKTARKSARSERIEIITRGERRRVWTPEQKREIVAKSLGSNLTPAQIARKHPISTGQLYTAVVQTTSAGSWSAWKSCSRIGTSTVRSSCCAYGGIFKLSLRDLVEMMAERGLSLPHTAIMRWVQRYTPGFEKRWHRHGLAVGRSWRVDETYVKIRGVWHYLYRAVDRAGRTVDFRLSGRRDVAAAKAFFCKAIKRQQRPPQTITLDGYAASHRAVRELKGDGSLPTETKLRSSKYLNNLIEQDHRSVKQRVAVMLGFKKFRNAAIMIAGIELMHPIRKGQFDLRRLGVQGGSAPGIWNAILGA